MPRVFRLTFLQLLHAVLLISVGACFLYVATLVLNSGTTGRTDGFQSEVHRNRTSLNGTSTKNITAGNETARYPAIAELEDDESSLQILERVRQRWNLSSWHNLTTTPSCLVPRTGTAKGPLPLPILNVGFPKCGSTSLSDFFRCGGLHSSHFGCANGACATCMRRAVAEGQPPVASCSGGFFNAYTQLDWEEPPNNCIFPQIQFLDEIHGDEPNATFILAFRDINKWIRSVNNWRNHFSDRLTRCDLPGFPSGVGGTDDDKKEWFCTHVEHIREFVALHPSHALIEVDIEDPTSGKFLSELFGFDEKCWGNKNQNPILH